MGTRSPHGKKEKPEEKSKKNHKISALDLHGFLVADVIDKVDRFIVNSNQSGVSRARIMSGKGSGKVRNEVIRYLKLGGFPWEYEAMDSGRRNEGVIVVFLD